MTIQSPILFLDFDGVLHSALGDSAGPAFCHASMLAEALATLPDVRIVVTSSYREHHTLDHMRYLLGPLGKYVVGQTPVKNGQHVREIEIKNWLAEHPHPVSAYVVLDDDARLFEKGWAHLVLCDPRIGLTPPIAARVARLLQIGQ